MVGFDAKFCQLFILLLACRSTVALDNPTDAPVAKVMQSSWWHLPARWMTLDMLCYLEHSDTFWGKVV